MPFQKSVNRYPGLGLPGQLLGPVREAVFTASNYISDGTAEAGRFAFPVTVTENTDGVTYGQCGIKASGAKPLGIVIRHLTGQIMDPLAESATAFEEGAGVEIVVRGRVYMTATGSATDGQAILCDPATGTITYGTAGATNDTGWTVRLPQGVSTVANGDLIIAENFGVSVTPASA